MTAYIRGDEKTETGQAGDESGKADKEARFSGDSFWKDLAKAYFYPLLKRALPELYTDADTDAEPVFLDKEFTDVLKTSDPKKHNHSRFSDLLADVPLKNGTGEFVLFHGEAQSPGGGDLAERMNFYRCFVYAHYRREPATVAIIAGNRPKGETRRYSHSHYGTSIDYDYNNLVLPELDDEELLTSDNPIDVVLYAAKYAAMTSAEHQRYNYLRTATKLLAERGWSMDDKRSLLLFVQRVINLKDDKLKIEYLGYLEHLDKEGKIVYVSIAEEIYTKRGREKGIEEGRIEGKLEGRIEGQLEGKLEVARKLLANGVSPDIIAKSADLPQEKIRELMN
ncbi:MAG: hypothetical protein LBL73_11120 [Synergistaceae bacterium]|nr:hypothetical protein [Synergistaceae bacterium]